MPGKKRKRGRGMSMDALLIPLFFLAVVLIVLGRDWIVGGGESQEGQIPQTVAGEELQVYYLDVGQGDSELVRIPQGSGYYNMLIDTGEYEYADGLTETLEDLGVYKIDALVCSHPHTDHMGCMARIVQRFEIGGIYMPQPTEENMPTTSAYEALLDRVVEKGLTIQRLSEDFSIPVPDGASIQVCSPRWDAEWEDLNNLSAVLRLTWGSTSFLFTGDAEKESEEVILEDGFNVQADVLKCGHHGSSTSTSDGFLEAVDPRYAIVSCGKDNTYGHPHKEIVSKLERRGVTLYRTDQDGTILATSNGETVTFKTGLASVRAKDE